eukprot:s202_g21.t1
MVEHENRSVVVFADHFTVPYNHLIKKISDEKVVERAASIRNQFKGKTIIGAYDRFDCFSGLTLKLRTFHRFLQEYRSHRPAGQWRSFFPLGAVLCMTTAKQLRLRHAFVA